MVGYGEDRGIIPIASEVIFQRIGENDNPNLTYKVEASMMEIYNEKVKGKYFILCASSAALFSFLRRISFVDLFNPTQAEGGLKVRDNPKTGPYAEGPLRIFRS